MITQIFTIFRTYVVRRLVYLFVGMLLISTTATAQSASSNAAVKNDGRFTFGLSSVDSQNLKRQSNGLVTQLDVQGQWWTLIGQAVEIYGIKWERGDTYNLEGDTLYRSSLSEHPDLVSRYDALKPSNIEVSFDVVFLPDANRVQALNEMARLGSHYYVKGGGQAVGSKVTDNFLIGKSGELMTDLSPSSPRNWESFMRWKTLFVTGSYADTNAAAKNTFDIAQKVQVSNLRITKIDLPDSSAQAIFDEYQRREEEEKEEKEEDTEEENIWDEEEAASQDENKQDDDIWAESNYTESKSNSSSDNIWAESNYSDANSTSTSSDIWSDASVNQAKRAKEAELKRKKEACEKRSLKTWNGESCVDYEPVVAPRIVLYRKSND
ncbi:MAG: hypothetical protein ABJ275_04830 [Maricaulaceae bacterium]